MPQIFHKSMNTLVRLGGVGVVTGISGLFFFGSSFTGGALVTKATVPLDQPVPFSHKHHVKELGIDCRYCHASVEISAVASVPPTETCMSCHSQIWTNSPLLQPIRDSYKNNTSIVWNKVNNLPDFVYFNHSIHISKGIACVSCHSNIQNMQLTYKSQPFHMKWCLDCHRNPEKNIRPKSEVFNLEYYPAGNQLELGRKLVKEYHIHKEQLTNCSVCHH